MSGDADAGAPTWLLVPDGVEATARQRVASGLCRNAGEVPTRALQLQWIEVDPFGWLSLVGQRARVEPLRFPRGDFARTVAAGAGTPGAAVHRAASTWRRRLLRRGCLGGGEREC